MEENVSPELSLAPEPEQSQDRMDSCSEGEGANVPFQTKSENAAIETPEEPEKSTKANREVKKTWGFRRSTVAKREMPVEVATDSPESRCPVRRSGRQSKRTDKLEEFLSTAKRSTRKSAPPSLESGDPPSQTPTDVETASEASFDGNADLKAAEGTAESPERRTRSSARKQTQRKTRGGRLTRGGGRAAVKDDGSSENDEDNGDAANKPDDENEEKKDDLCPKDVGSANAAQPQPELDSVEKGVVDEKKGGADKNDDGETEESEDESDDESDDESVEKPTMVVKRGPIRTYINKKKAATKNNTSAKASAPANKGSAPVTRENKSNQGIGKTHKPQTDEEDDENDSSSTSSTSSSIESDDGGYDPNALYCICRQKHNKRFMICCDRCEEWFHGDCVGITEARGRLMERNGEDYICPNCTAKKNQLVRPATSVLSTSTEIGEPKADVAPQASLAAASAATSSLAAEKTNARGAESGPFTSQAAAAAAPPTSVSAATEEKGAEDQGIKGRIEKAINPTGKKKIKIFQPSIQQPAQPKADQTLAPTVEKKPAATAEQKSAPDPEQKVASNIEVNTTPAPEEKTGQTAKEESSLPKCIGPGCENNAQPDSVYCGNDCILRHAAAAMKSITDVKEPKQKDKPKAQKTKSTPKRSAAGGKKTQKKSREDSESDEDYSPESDEEEEDDEDENAEEHPPPPATASWSSDHNYIAVTPEKTTPISPTVLNKKCMYLFEGFGLLLKPCCGFSIINVVPVMLA